MSDPTPGPTPSLRPRPDVYGNWWNSNDLGLDWYKQIHGVRHKVHDGFLSWFRAEQAEKPFHSIMEVGCGRAWPYADLFADFAYTGVDISAKEIEWCRTNHQHPGHRFWCGDILVDAPDQRADLVFSHAVIDHVWDINRFLERVTALADRAVYITAFRGWFPDLPAHRYEWLDGYACYNNDLSVPETHRVLAGLGYRDVVVTPVDADNVADGIERETLIIVRK